MTDKEERKCPNCKSKLYKNGLRNEKQRWRCYNSTCKYNCTDGDKYITKPKQRAINFLYNLISTIDEKSGKEILETNKNIIQTSILCNENIEIEVSKNVENEKLNIDDDLLQASIDDENIAFEVNDIHINGTPKVIPSRSYLLYIEENKINLINLQYADKGLRLKYKSPGIFELENPDDIKQNESSTINDKNDKT